tara:strand:- start:10 stop:468 length:459 start_codon:yes stop_codon:yes gene_type:complete
MVALAFGLSAFGLNDRLRQCRWSLVTIATWLASLALALLGGAVLATGYTAASPWGGGALSTGDKREGVLQMGVIVTALLALVSAFTWTRPKPDVTVDKDGEKQVVDSASCDPYMSRFLLFWVSVVVLAAVAWTKSGRRLPSVTVTQPSSFRF